MRMRITRYLRYARYPKLVLTTALALSLSPINLIGQPSQQAPQSYQFFASAPPSVTSGSGSVTGNLGSTTYYYWIIAKYTIGNASAYGPIIVRNAPSRTTGSNYVTVSWNTPASSVSGYDVIRLSGTAVPPLPASCTNCLIASDTSLTILKDDGQSLSNYTVTTIGSAQGNIFLNNSNYSAPTMVFDGGTNSWLFMGSVSCTGTPCGTASSGGTVTNFSAGNLSPLFTTSVGTPTTTPVLSFTQVTQAANLVFAGPSTGSAANPTFRALVAADIPSGLPNVVYNNQVNTGTAAFTLDASGSTVSNAFKVPAQANLTVGVAGATGEDTTATMYHNYTGGVDSLQMTVPKSASITNGHCTDFSVSGSVITLADAGAACGSGGGGSVFPLTIVQESQAASAGNVNSFTVTFPQTTAASGDTAFIILVADQTITQPSGWTVDFNSIAGADCRLWMVHKTTASDTSATFTSSGIASWAAYFFEVSGSHTLDKSTTPGGVSSAGGSITFSSITPTTGAAVIASACYPGVSSTNVATSIAPPFNPLWHVIQMQGSAQTSGVTTPRSLGAFVYGAASNGSLLLPPQLNFGSAQGSGVGQTWITFSIL